MRRNRILDNINDDYIRKCFVDNGYGWNHPNIKKWISLLQEEGYTPNSYAINVLKEFGGIKMNTMGDAMHKGVKLWMDPYAAASGMFDWIEQYRQYCDEELFPIAELFSDILYVVPSGKVYSGGGRAFSYWGESFEEFLFTVFNKNSKGRILLYDFNKVIAFQKIMEDIDSRFKWLDLSQAKMDKNCQGWPDQLIEKYVVPQLLSRFSINNDIDSDLLLFFEYVDELLMSTNLELYVVMKVSLLEKIVNLINFEILYTYCGEKAKSIIMNLR